MASRGSTSWSGGEQRTARAPGAAGRIAPLYKRLPHGPHRLPRAAVIRHQRARIHGAMVEAVAQSGYWGASVKQVIGLAGVSRRSFYEQFANKQECFLATFDLLAGRALRQTVEAYRAVDGGVEERLERDLRRAHGRGGGRTEARAPARAGGADGGRGGDAAAAQGDRHVRAAARTQLRGV